RVRGVQVRNDQVEDQAVHDEERRHDHVGERGQEIRPPLPADDREEPPHGAPSAGPAAASGGGGASAAGGTAPPSETGAGSSSSCRVRRTKTSSSERLSRVSSRSTHPRATAM